MRLEGLEKRIGRLEREAAPGTAIVFWEPASEAEAAELRARVAALEAEGKDVILFVSGYAEIQP